MINEGGSVEIDGHGALMACKSSILNSNRNPNMSQSKAEAIFTKYLGVTHCRYGQLKLNFYELTHYKFYNVTD